VAVRGKPERLDAVWRPVWFVLLGLAGLGGSAFLAFVGDWLWMPLPFAGAILLHQVVFWIRGDRPLRVSLEGETLSIADRRTGRDWQVDLGAAHAVSLGVRPGQAPGEHQVFLAAHDGDRALVALRIHTPHEAFPDGTTPLEALQPVLGGNAGILRGLAPQDRLVRQTLLDRDGAFTRALLDALPADALDRVAVRVWRGEAPPMDFMGLHQGPPDALLLCEGEAVRLVPRIGGEPHQARLEARDGGRSSRALQLLDVPGVAETPAARLPLLVWTLAPGLTLAIPCPIAGHKGEEVALDEGTLHTHLAEGAHLVWWLLDRLDAGAIPDGLLEAISDSRIAQEHPPTTLRRHLAARPGVRDSAAHPR